MRAAKPTGREHPYVERRPGVWAAGTENHPRILLRRRTLGSYSASDMINRFVWLQSFA